MTTPQTQPKRTAARPTPPDRPRIDLEELARAAHDELTSGKSELSQKARSSLEAGGLADAIEPLHLGAVSTELAERYGAPNLAGRLSIPYLRQGRVLSVVGRALTGERPAVVRSAGKAPAPFHAEGLRSARQHGQLVLTLDELDAVSLVAVHGPDYPVLGVPGGSLPRGWAKRIAELDAPVLLVTHPDPARQAWARRLEGDLTRHGVHPRVARMDDHHSLAAALRALGRERFAEYTRELFERAQLEGVSDLYYLRGEFLADMDDRAARPHTTYPTGIKELDDTLEGGYGEGLHLLGGITGGGKTSLALHIALVNALEGRPVLYTTYEQSRRELWARLAARLTHVPYGAMKRGTYRDGTEQRPTSGELRRDERGWAELEKAARHLKIIEGGDALSRTDGAGNLDGLARTAERMTRDAGAPPLVIIDYLQRMPAPPELRGRDIRERVGHAAGALQVRLARELGCPVLALSSLGRASYQLNESQPELRLAAFKEAGELEYTAYTALLLYPLPENEQARLGLTPTGFNPYHPMRLDLCKHREGHTAQLTAVWRPRTGTWEGA